MGLVLVHGRCFSNIYIHLAVMKCHDTSRMLTAAAELQTVLTGSISLQMLLYPAANMPS
jgi:hypothetical protein